jgi:hypothetical protein
MVGLLARKINLEPSSTYDHNTATHTLNGVIDKLTFYFLREYHKSLVGELNMWHLVSINVGTPCLLKLINIMYMID